MWLDMTQGEIDLVYNITIVLATNTWFKDKSRDEVQEWVRQQLALHDIYTIPVGMSWGMQVGKDLFDQHTIDLRNRKDRNNGIKN